MSMQVTRLQFLCFSLCFVSSFLSHLVSALDDNRTCYLATNDEAPYHKPCVPIDKKPISHCCASVDTCLGDTLCLSQWGTLYVGACTVKEWATGNYGLGDCPKYCKNYYENNSDPSIGLCSQGTYPFSFCCNALQGTDECCSGDLFKVDNVTSQFQYEVSPSASSSPAPSSTTTSASTSASTCPVPSDEGHTKVGIGVGLGVPLAIALGLLFWEFRKRRLAEARLVQYQTHGMHGPETTQFLSAGDQHNYYQQYGALGAPHGRALSPTLLPEAVHEIGAEREQELPSR